MKAIAFFNNKGGVGKTTSICNVASILSTQYDNRVALIDCDPQCNSTQLVLGTEKIEDLYASKSSQGTLGYAIRPLKVGDRAPNLDVEPQTENEFGVDLFAGHPDLSIIEDKLSANWGSLMAGEIEGFRVNLWLKYLIDYIGDDYDYIFIDVGPSLGALNRSVLLACDGFITPLGSDIFSIMGIENIGSWLKDWLQKYNTGYENLDKEYAEEYAVPRLPGVANGYLGYTVQQYTTKTDAGGKRRKVAAYDNIIKKMPSSIQNSLGRYLSNSDYEPSLGDIPFLYSLVPLAQQASVPIHKLSSEHGLRGSRYTLANKYKKEMISLANAVKERAS